MDFKHMINEFLFFIQIVIVTGIGVLSLKLGKEALITLFCLQGILANMLILKQITLFSLHVTATDVFSIGSILSLNLIQEYFGKETAQKAILINLAMTLFYLGITFLHSIFIPNSFDTMHGHYQNIFHYMPRIVLASLLTATLVQYFDTYFFQFLQNLFKQKYFTLRATISLILSQIIDTCLFTVLGMYGIVASITHLIIVSLVIKLITIFLVSFFIGFIRKFITSKS